MSAGWSAGLRTPPWPLLEQLAFALEAGIADFFVVPGSAAIGTRGSVGIAVSPDADRVYAANLSDQSLSVIDTETDTVIATVPSGVWLELKVA
jgi:YVTN family beta-propeller protein